MSDRIIFHADCNNFFASCECLERPELRLVPMAVAGDPESRKGIQVNHSAPAQGWHQNMILIGKRAASISACLWPNFSQLYLSMASQMPL